MRRITALRLAGLALLLAGCAGPLGPPTSLEERLRAGGPGSPECRRLERYLLRPGDDYGTAEYHRLRDLYLRYCTGRVERR